MKDKDTQLLAEAYDEVDAATPKEFTIKSPEGYYAKKRKPGTFYTDPIWYWTKDINKARLMTKDTAVGVRMTLWTEIPQWSVTDAYVVQIQNGKELPVKGITK